jgi:hemerythrin-like domain-containing protein
VADLLVMELASMDRSDERFVAKATVLVESVTHHIQEEEEEWFPKVREGLTRTQLREIGAELAAAKERAPRRPEQPSALKKTVDAVIA